MPISFGRDNSFALTITSGQLSKGLRPSKRVPRNSGFLVQCNGSVGRDGVLQVIDQLTRLATAAITDPFPYPQIFVFTNMIIVCGETKIYEWVADALVEKLTVAAGDTWSAVDFHNYVYMSNGEVAVIRDAMDKVYKVVSDLPVAQAICNFNGQIVAGGLT